jgi:uncharacterized protein YoxC
VLDDQLKDLAVDLEGVQATITITVADVKDIVATMEALGARVLDLETRLANQQEEKGRLIHSSVEQTVTKMLTMGILAMDTTDPVEEQVKRQNGALREMIRRRDTIERDEEESEVAISGQHTHDTDGDAEGLVEGEEVGGLEFESSGPTEGNTEGHEDVVATLNDFASTLQHSEEMADELAVFAGGSREWGVSGVQETILNVDVNLRVSMMCFQGERRISAFYKGDQNLGTFREAYGWNECKDEHNMVVDDSLMLMMCFSMSSTAILSSLSTGVKLLEHDAKLLGDLSTGQDSEPFGHVPTNLAELPYPPLLALTIV